MKYNRYIFIFVLFISLLSSCLPLSAQESDQSSAVPPAAPPAAPPAKLTLGRSVVCEEVRDHAPFNPAIVFSIALGKVACFSDFTNVPEKTLIYHNWFRMDKLNAKIKLLLTPPRWSTHSIIQLRETDKGPWRVEITDQDNSILQIIRFSITD